MEGSTRICVWLIWVCCSVHNRKIVHRPKSFIIVLMCPDCNVNLVISQQLLCVWSKVFDYYESVFLTIFHYNDYPWYAFLLYMFEMICLHVWWIGSHSGFCDCNRTVIFICTCTVHWSMPKQYYPWPKFSVFRAICFLITIKIICIYNIIYNIHK